MDVVAGVPVGSAGSFPDAWRAIDTGNTRDAPDIAEVRKAFRKAARTIHPDRLSSSASVHERAACTEVFGVLSAAHGVVQETDS
jgi:hypothetical protein